MKDKSPQRLALEKAGGKTITALLDALAVEIRKMPPTRLGTVDFPPEVRYELMRLACSVDDYTFWVHETEDGWVAEEIESGYSSDPEPTPEETLKAYWKGTT